MRPLALAPTVLWTAIATAQGTVSPSWLAAHRTDPGLVTIHAAMDRTGYDGGHVPGARYAPLMSFHSHGATLPPADDLSRAIAALGVSDRSQVILVGDPLSTALLFLAFDYLGRGDRVRILDGGLAGWKAAGLPLERESPSFEPAVFHGAPRPDVVVDAPWVASRLAGSGIALIDGRSKAEYEGTTTREGLPRPGHIPGAALLDWRDTFEPGSDRLLPADTLRARFAAAGLAPGDTLVAYCTVGMRASHLYFVARTLGLPARIYVGSMADWSARSELPVAGPPPAPR